MNADIAALRAGLSAAAAPEQAAPMRAYMREQFDFLGVPTPARRKVSTPWIRALKTHTAEYCLDLAEQLWRQPEREFQYAAVDLLTARAEALPAASLPRLLTLAAAKPWWDCVDGLAAWVVGTLARQHRDLQHDMDALSGDADFWLRRVAILHQLRWKTDTDAERLFRYCAANAGDAEFFIRKAIGWALREYAYTDARAVRAFVAATPLSGLSRREALKHIARSTEDFR